MARPPKDPNPVASTGGVANSQGQSIFTGDWNALITDYVSQTDISAQALVSALTISPPSSLAASTPGVLLNGAGNNAVGGGSSILKLASNANSDQPTNWMAIDISSKNQAHSGSRNVLNISGVADLNGQTGMTLNGLIFAPSLGNTGAGVGTAVIQSLIIGGGAGTPANASTISIATGAKIQPPQFSVAGWTCTTRRGLQMPGTSGIGVVTDILMDLTAPTAGSSSNIAIQQSGATASNRFASPIRVGDINPPLTTVDIRGSLSVGVITVTTTYSALSTDYLVLSDGTTAAFTVTLPAATQKGQKIVVVKIDSSVNAITVAPNGTDTIEGAASLSLATQYNKANLIADGVGIWYDLGKGLV